MACLIEYIWYECQPMGEWDSWIVIDKWICLWVPKHISLKRVEWTSRLDDWMAFSFAPSETMKWTSCFGFFWILGEKVKKRSLPGQVKLIWIEEGIKNYHTTRFKVGSVPFMLPASKTIHFKNTYTLVCSFLLSILYALLEFPLTFLLFTQNILYRLFFVKKERLFQ